jgi:hypothetical protein
MAFRVHLYIGVINCSAERVFSKIVRLNNDLHASVCNSHLNMLYLMMGEKALLRQKDFKDFITAFAYTKSRKNNSRIM